MVIYSVYIRFWPTLLVNATSSMLRMQEAAGGAVSHTCVLNSAASSWHGLLMRLSRSQLYPPNLYLCTHMRTRAHTNTRTYTHTHPNAHNQVDRGNPYSGR